MKDIKQQREAIKKAIDNHGTETARKHVTEMRALCSIDLDSFTADQEDNFHQLCRDYMEAFYPDTCLSLDELEAEISTIINP